MVERTFGFFSGFPDRRFPREIAERLKAALGGRESLVFVSAWPSDHEQNDADSDGMHAMFVEWGLGFKHHCVIDDRTDAQTAVELIRGADCVFFMGGHPELQFELIQKLGIDKAIREGDSTVLGVSAGSINMAKRSLDTKESLVPYDGMGLADVTIKPHFEPANKQVLADLLQVSAELPIHATTDNSAIFVRGGEVEYFGEIYLVDKGEITPVSE